MRCVLFSSRLCTPIAFGMLYLLLMACLRLALMLASLDDMTMSFGQVAAIFGIGLLYDLAFYSYAMAPFVLCAWLLPDRWFNSKPVYWSGLLLTFTLSSGLLFVLAAEWLFWDEFQARFNFIAVDYLVYRKEVVQNISESYPLIPILGAIFLLAGLCVLILRRFVRVTHGGDSRLPSRTAWAIPLLCLPLVAFICVDQSLRDISCNTFNNELAANGPYQFMAAFRSNELNFRQFYRFLPDEEAVRSLQEALARPGEEWLGTGAFDIRRHIAADGAEKPLNVVLVTVESLSAGFLGAFGDTRGITPNLDRLAEDSLLFTRLYATGSRTTRGLEAISLSIPPTPGQSLVKRPKQFGSYNISSEFQARGYDVAFFYGGFGYFDNMNSFFSHNGFRVVDESDLREDEKGFATAWGVADEYVYKRILREADADHQAGKRFFYYFMTTSNHRPYTFPAGRIDLPSGTREAVVKYTDWAIGDFIAQARQRPWFDDTVFIFVADHCSSSAGREALSARQHHIPLLIYAPRHLNPQRIEALASQIDVAPTLLGLLNFSYESRFFGHDILRAPASAERAFIANYQYLGLMREDALVYLKPQRQIGFIRNPLASEAHENALPVDADSLLKEAVSLYQGADAAYRNHFLEWQPIQAVPLRY